MSAKAIQESHDVVVVGVVLVCLLVCHILLKMSLNLTEALQREWPDSTIKQRSSYNFVHLINLYPLVD